MKNTNLLERGCYVNLAEFITFRSLSCFCKKQETQVRGLGIVLDDSLLCVSQSYKSIHV